MATSDDNASGNLYLAIDQGGHASRALVFDAQGQLHAEAFAEITTQHPTPDQVEHHPDELLQSIRVVLDEIAHQLGPACARVRAAGLATQRSSIVCWDRLSGAALSPVISWQDRRAARWLETFADQSAEIHARTGLQLSPHYGVSKLRWCLEHLPAVSDALAEGRLAWGPLASFVLFRLLEEQPFKVDPANASRTLLWDLRTRDWSAELLARFSLPRAALPECVPSRHRFGTLQLGPYCVPLTVTTGDQSAALFATGNPTPDTLYANLGTGAFVQRLIADTLPDPGALLAGVVFSNEQGACHVLEGTVNGAGCALEWLRQQLQLTPPELQQLLSETLAPGASPPLFLNGISGLGSPYWIANFPSRFVGIGNPQDQVYAVLESIVFLLSVNIEHLSHYPPRPQRIQVSGGLAAHDQLCQCLADVTTLPVYRPVIREATARGLAFLLADAPEDWPTESAPACFPATAQPALRQRFEQWRHAMETEADHCSRRAV